MTRCMNVTIGIEVTEEEVRKWLKSIGGYNNEAITDQDYLDYAEIKYSQGYGTHASFCD